MKKGFKRAWLVAQVLLFVTLMVILFGGGVAAGFFASHIDDEPYRTYDELYEDINAIHQTGEAYFNDGALIGELRTDSHLYPVKIDEISDVMIHALLTAEDNDFFEHEGVSVRGITRAVQEELMTPGEGSGGSTITQQLVKNQILDPERSFERKFREIILAIRVERMFDKAEILESYLNVVYFGLNANGKSIEGIQAAAEGIFGVDAAELDLAQSAYLAGMIQAPGRYAPFNPDQSINEENLERGKNRAHWVLQRMLETERITQEEYREALNKDYTEDLAESSTPMVEEYPYLTYSIERRASAILADMIMEREGTEREDYEEGELQTLALHELARGGYKVYTTIDQELYDAFHERADQYAFGPRSSETFTYEDPETGEEEERGYLEQAAATLINNDTGEIMAMLEGRDFEESQIDYTNRWYQPGSSIKPILDYAPALEEGILQPASVIDDVPLFDYGERPPMNANHDFRGLMSVREALRVSQNIPAIKAFRQIRDEIGEDALYEYAQELGLRHISEEDITYDSTAIGGPSRGWTVEDGTAAFATFANEGRYQPPYMIRRIETMDGEVVYEHDVRPNQVFSEETAFLMNDMLREVVNESGGTAHRIIGQQLGQTGLDIAGKTGTTNAEQDYWFIGYTPQISLGLWMGYSHRDSLQGEYRDRHQQLWVQLLQTVQEVRPEYTNPEHSFEQPESIVRQTVCSKSGKLPSDLCEQEDYLTSDFFHPDYVPIETDDTVVRERTVIVDGKPYIALESTPDDMLATDRSHIVIKREPLHIPEEYQDERSRWLPDDWDDTAPTEADPRQDNGRTPSTPANVQIGNSSLTWDAVDEEDIAGYRIYLDTGEGTFEHIASVLSHESNRYEHSGSPDADYVVTAVDIVGRESDPSDDVELSSPDDSWVNDEEEETADSDQALVEPERDEESVDPDAPSAPSGVEVSGSLDGVTVEWEANSSEDEVERYNVYVLTSNGYIQNGHTASTSYSYTPQGTRNNQFYVTAVNDAGESEPSATVMIDLE